MDLSCFQTVAPDSTTVYVIYYAYYIMWAKPLAIVRLRALKLVDLSEAGAPSLLEPTGVVEDVPAAQVARQVLPGEAVEVFLTLQTFPDVSNLQYEMSDTLK